MRTHKKSRKSGSRAHFSDSSGAPSSQHAASDNHTLTLAWYSRQRCWLVSDSASGFGNWDKVQTASTKPREAWNWGLMNSFDNKIITQLPSSWWNIRSNKTFYKGESNAVKYLEKFKKQMQNWAAHQGSEKSDPQTRGDYLFLVLSHLHAVIWLTDSILILFKERN